MRIARAALTFSFLAFWGLAAADQYSDLAAKIKDSQDPSKVIQEVSQSSVAKDPTISSILQDGDYTEEEIADELKAVIDMRSMLESPAATAPKATDIQKIKSTPLYRDSGVDQTSNWLARALERLKNLRFDRKPSSTGIDWLAGLGPAIYALFWALISACLIGLIYFAVKHFRWRQRLERRASALLEEDEPERTLDEWLEMAAKLEAEGKFREAVRALYLACLLRFDEALIARFDRSQTNWEHLARIERSDKLPAELDFRSPTKRFDRIWYGYQVRGAEDVQEFRQFYLSVTEALKGAAP